MRIIIDVPERGSPATIVKNVSASEFIGRAATFRKNGSAVIADRGPIAPI
jgi:hypothetical protein